MTVEMQAATSMAKASLVHDGQTFDLAPVTADVEDEIASQDLVGRRRCLQSCVFRSTALRYYSVVPTPTEVYIIPHMRN